MSFGEVAQSEPSPMYGALMQGTPAPVAGFAAPAPEQPLAMSHDEIANVQAIIQQYSSYPGVSQAFAAMVTANSQNPEHLASLVREMVDQIEQVKANPHVRTPVNPAIAQAVESIREAELQKPDPLNVLRPEQQNAEQKQEAQPFTLGNLIAPIVEVQQASQASAVPSFGNLMWGEKQQTVEFTPEKSNNPFAAALAGNEGILASLASMNGQIATQSQDRSAIGQFAAPLAALSKASPDTGFDRSA